MPKKPAQPAPGAPISAPAQQLAPPRTAPEPSPALADEGCLSCHAGLMRRKVIHEGFRAMSCGDCHKPTGKSGRCKSPVSGGWALTEVRERMCTSCHDPGQLTAAYKVKHEPVLKGLCLDCHDAHSSDLPHLLRVAGKAECLRCHDSGARGQAKQRVVLSRRYVHQPVTDMECQDCHTAGHGGSGSKLLAKQQPDLCYDCHQRKDTAREVHTAVRAGECLECHDAHSSNLPALLAKPREQVCLPCHEVEALVPKQVKHAPVSEGRCLDCHDPHGSNLPKATRATGKSLCLRCHERRSPTGRGTPGTAFRIDFTKKRVHQAVGTGECQDCHEQTHSSSNLRMLRKPPPDLCYGCHKRVDGDKYVHGAVKAGDCSVCHEPHSSENPKLLAKAAAKDLCFVCHQDDVTGRAVLHKPVAEGRCPECHGAHGAKFRNLSTHGEGKQACYACHKPMDGVKVRHGALDRYGCTGCHDPHGTANRGMLPRKTNDLCVSCHPDRPDGQHVSVVAGRGGHVVSGLLDPRRPGREFSCASCHNPHGSDFPKLFYSGATPMDSCAGCHGDKSGANPGMKNIVSNARPKPPAAEAPVTRAVAGGGEPGAGAPGDVPAAVAVPAPDATPAPGAAPGTAGGEDPKARQEQR